MEISQLNGNTLVDATFYEYVHTVGAVIFSFNNSFSPSALWGGSWSRVTNRFLIGSGGTYSTGVTGGETSVTLTVDQTPNHTHEAVGYNEGNPASSGNFLALGRRTSDSPNVELRNAINPTGGGQPHNNMPPYRAAYIWRRTA